MNHRLVACVGAGALSLAAVPLLPAGAGAGGAPDASVRIVHAMDLTSLGLGGSPVTVCLDDVKIDGADPFTLSNEVPPLDMTSGTYNVKVLEGDPADCTGPALVDSDIDIPVGASTVMAYMSNTLRRAPAVVVLADDDDCTAPGSGRVVARHAAQAEVIGTPTGNVDVLADGDVLFPGLVNGAQAEADVAAATYAVTVNQAGTATSVLGPIGVDVADAVVSEVYVYGGVSQNPLPDAAAFVLPRDVEPCPATVETTTTTTAPPTPTPAPAAQAVATRATFTG
jgi:hypothetical protein